MSLPSGARFSVWRVRSKVRPLVRPVSEVTALTVSWLSVGCAGCHLLVFVKCVVVVVSVDEIDLAHPLMFLMIEIIYKDVWRCIIPAANQLVKV